MEEVGLYRWSHMSQILHYMSCMDVFDPLSKMIRLTRLE